MKRMKKSWLLCIVSALAMLCLVLGACGNSVTFKFDTQGGPEISAEKMDKGSDFTLPIPEREGYSFEGWYLSSDFSGSPVTSQQADKDCTFYAKWEKMYLVTLDAAGGTLSAGSFYLKAGENIADAVAEYVPTKTDCLFGNWRRDGADLSSTAVMPQSDITLTARYKVGYTVEIYEQKLDNTSEYVQVESVKDYAFADGKEFAPEVTKNGFELSKEHDGQVLSKQLSESDPSSNLFRMYFDRTEVTVFFQANDGTQAENRSIKGLYGAEIELPTDYVRDGYLLTGWSASSDGEDPYLVDIPGQNAYNSTETVQPTKYTLTENTMLFAVWSQGYTDMFGGVDCIYVLGEKVYLERGGVFFLGSKRGDLYLFENNGDIMLTARLFDNMTFCYSSEARANLTATLFDAKATPDATEEEMKEGYYDFFVRSTTLHFDEYNGITYSVKDESGVTATSKGTYTFDEEGAMHTAFTSGPMVGKDFVFITGTATDKDGITQNAFQIQNASEVALGTLPRFGFTGSAIAQYAYYQVSFDGFGYAVYNYEGQEVTLNYSMHVNEEGEMDEFVLLSDGEVVLDGVLMSINGTLGYASYNVNFHATFNQPQSDDEEEEATDSLILDGTFNAIYHKGSQTINGYYFLTEELLAGNIVVFVDPADPETEYLFQVWGEKGVTGTPYYYFEELSSNYAELYYSVEGAAQYSPLIVIDGEGADENHSNFTLYALDANRQRFVAIVKGTVTSEDLTDTSFDGDLKNMAVVTETLDTETALYEAVGFDVHKLKSFVYSAVYMSRSDGSVMLVAYWWSYTLEGEGGGADTTVGLSEKYTGQDKTFEEGSTATTSATLTVVSGFAYYEVNGESYWGTVSTNEICTIFTGQTADQDAPKTIARYFLLSEDGNTFECLNGNILGYAYLRDEAGDTSGYIYVAMDGKGGATYTVVTPAETEDAEDTTDETKGTIARKGTEQTVFGDDIYTFTQTDGDLTFDLIFYSDGTYLYYSVADSFGGSYTNDANGGTLLLDGYSFSARLTSEDGSELSGLYTVVDKEAKLICFITSLDGETTVELYFDLRDGNKYTTRGGEYRNYLLVDNRMQSGFLSLDGYGKFEISVIDEEAEGDTELKVSAKGTYVLDDETGYYVLTYTEGSEQTTLVVELGIAAVGSNYYYAAYVVYEETVATYVNGKDWSVLVLDGTGSALRITGDGGFETGVYYILSENMLYYLSDDSSFGSVYNYNKQVGTITVPGLKETGYFTSELDSLLFTRYGTVVQNGVVICYYSVESDNVTLYYPDQSEQANKYGYLTKSFGSFSEESKQFETDGTSKTYHKSSGLAISFTRTGNTSAYPLPLSQTKKSPLGMLTFTPRGTGDYTTTASVLIDGTQYTATVSCETAEDGTASYAVLFGTNGGGYFEYTITINYQGEDNSTYEVTSMSLVQPLYAYDYIEAWMVFYQFGGPEYAARLQNTWGMLLLYAGYDEAGTFSGYSVEGAFGASSHFVDAKGELISSLPRTQAAILQVSASGTSALFGVEFENASDGCTYCLYFQDIPIDDLGITAYYVNAFTRVQEVKVTDHDNMTLTLETVVTSDGNMSAGDIFDVALTVGEQKPAIVVDLEEDEYLFIMRDPSEHTGTESAESTHYLVKLTREEESGAVTGATAEQKTATAYYSNSGSYIEAYEGDDGDLQIVFVAIYTTTSAGTGWDFHLVKETSKTADKTYKVTTYGTTETTYIIMIDENDGITIMEAK